MLFKAKQIPSPPAPISIPIRIVFHLRGYHTKGELSCIGLNRRKVSKAFTRPELTNMKNIPRLFTPAGGQGEKGSQRREEELISVCLEVNDGNDIRPVAAGNFEQRRRRVRTGHSRLSEQSNRVNNEQSGGRPLQIRPRHCSLSPASPSRLA